MPALFTDPPVITVPSAPLISVFEGIPRFYGPYRIGSAIWGAGFRPKNPSQSKIGIIKSIDGGATWALQGTPPATPNINNGYYDFAFDASTIHTLGNSGIAFLKIYNAFDIASGTFGTSITSTFGGGFWKLASYNSNPIVIFNLFSGGTGTGKDLQYSVINSGVFGTPITLVAGVASTTYVPLSTILDPLTGTLHILYQSNAPSSVSKLWYVALDSSGGVSTPTLLATNTSSWVTPLDIGIGAIWTDLSSVRHLLWATRGPNTPGTGVTLYDGANPASPTWTTNHLAFSPSSDASNARNAHVIVSGGIAYIWFYYGKFSSTISEVRYCTWDGSTFSTPLVAWDVVANPAAGDPTDYELDTFSVAANGSGWDLFADEYIDGSFNQSLVFLTQGGAGPTHHRSLVY